MGKLKVVICGTDIQGSNSRECVVRVLFIGTPSVTRALALNVSTLMQSEPEVQEAFACPMRRTCVRHSPL